MVFEQAVIEAAQVRAKPIMLTALAAMIGALFILDDPIFNGLAISLIFGILVSTLLTLVVIPLLYYSLLVRRSQRWWGQRAPVFWHHTASRASQVFIRGNNGDPPGSCDPRPAPG